MYLPQSSCVSVRWRGSNAKSSRQPLVLRLPILRVRLMLHLPRKPAGPGPEDLARLEPVQVSVHFLRLVTTYVFYSFLSFGLVLTIAFLVSRISAVIRLVLLVSRFSRLLLGWPFRHSGLFWTHIFNNFPWGVLMAT